MNTLKSISTRQITHPQHQLRFIDGIRPNNSGSMGLGVSWEPLVLSRIFWFGKGLEKPLSNRSHYEVAVRGSQQCGHGWWTMTVLSSVFSDFARRQAVATRLVVYGSRSLNKRHSFKRSRHPVTEKHFSVGTPKQRGSSKDSDLTPSKWKCCERWETIMIAWIYRL